MGKLDDWDLWVLKILLGTFNQCLAEGYPSLKVSNRLTSSELVNSMAYSSLCSTTECMDYT